MEKSDDNYSRSWTHVKVLGRGAFGIVELWKNEHTGENIAIKKCHLVPEQMSSRQIERWEEEVAFMKKMKHPNIVSTKPLPDNIVKKNSILPILCMEYCKKGDLRQVLDKPENFCGIQEKEALKIMQSIASAVEYLHSLKITHRDLKPENIVLQEGTMGTIYKLMDLGFAKQLGNESIAASVVGTLHYLAPELLWKDSYSCSVDYWSLGILFYEIVKGSRPFFPNAGINSHWMSQVKKKKYNHISAKEINDKVEFSTTIDDPSNVSQCVRDDLVPWFRLVLQWDPHYRGRIIENNQITIVIFKQLKLIFEKKIIHMFFVSKYKKEAYSVDRSITVGEVQSIIETKENIPIKDQILTTWKGRPLDNAEENIVDCLESEVLIVFEKDKLLIEDVNRLKILEDNEPANVSMRKCDYLTAKCYYSATIFFMKQELNLLNAYIIALSIKIDLCEVNYVMLSAKIPKMVEVSNALQLELQQLSPEGENEPTTSKKSDTSQQLYEKVTNFMSSAHGISQELQNLYTAKEKWKDDFGNLSSTKMDEIIDAAEAELILLISRDPRQPQVPRKMMQLYFRFLQVRHSILTSDCLVQVAKGFLDVESGLMKLEMSFKSFETVLAQYQKDFLDFKSDNSTKGRPSNSQTNTGCEDELIKDNIVLGHLITEILTDMEDITTKLALLD